MNRLYMFSRYSRIWHWTQAVLAMLLLLTGVEIHWPGIDIIGFAGAVRIHYVLGLLLIANAAGALVYHLVTGHFRHFEPQRRGLFTRLFAQIRYYVHGMFRGEDHPEHKSLENRLNPLQQISYMGLVNLLLPVLSLTGLLLLLAPRYPGLMSAIGGLGWPAGVHTLGAWLMMTFLVGHVYLTTTGHTPTALTRAMITGWEEVPVSSSQTSAQTPAEES